MQKRSIVAVLLLTILTCGIYSLFWLYGVRSETRDYLGKSDINPGLELLFCILCLPYMIYWMYKCSKDLMLAEAKAGLPQNDNSAINMILTVFGFQIVSMLIIQSQVNAIAERAALQD